MMDAAIRERSEDMLLARPIHFRVGRRRFRLHAPTLGKLILLSREGRGFLAGGARDEAAVLEACRLRPEQASRLLALHTLSSPRRLMDPAAVGRRAAFFARHLDCREVATLLMMATSPLTADELAHAVGLDTEDTVRRRIAAHKAEGGAVSFGGRSLWGAMADAACHRYGWTLHYVLWGISHANLCMLLRDIPDTVHLTAEERRALHVSSDRTVINGDDPAALRQILQMNWD